MAVYAYFGLGLRRLWWFTSRLPTLTAPHTDMDGTFDSTSNSDHQRPD
jgi:hypothetical protein